MEYESFSASDTLALGEKIAKNAAAGQVYCLDGDLGVGKTVFTKGFAKGLGITEHVNSPTFTILQVYEGRLPLYHFDVYRIEDEEELYEIGAEDYFYGKGVCLVEWAENVPGMIPPDAVHVRIEKDLQKGFDYRRITII
jgi:tRNA threonylcarbamoyladenosine biosynthesis protein TsaE